MSQIIIHESSDLMGTTSEDDELDNQHKGDMNLFAKQMVRSEDNTDKRFINMYRVRNAGYRKVDLGFLGFDKDPDPSLIKPSMLEEFMIRPEDIPNEDKEKSLLSQNEKTISPLYPT